MKCVIADAILLEYHGSMPSRHYCLAQVNVARMSAPIDSPALADFVAQLARVNELADRSPGFVWRLATAEGDSTAVRAYDDPFILFNMSVWESVDDLKQFTYSADHLAVMRDRGKWFERPKEAQLGLWWAPRGHTPTVEEGVERLAFRRAHGDTLAAFSLAAPFPTPDEPPDAGPLPAIDLNGREFAPVSNTPNGDAGRQTRFHYRQTNDRVWATYGGGAVRFGCLVGSGDPEGRLDVRYHHVDSTGAIRTGLAKSTPMAGNGEFLRLQEEWRWTNGDGSRGVSIIEEVR